MFEFLFQLVQVPFLTILEMAGVTMKPIMLDVALMVVTVVDLMSSLGAQLHHTARWNTIFSHIYLLVR